MRLLRNSYAQYGLSRSLHFLIFVLIFFSLLSCGESESPNQCADELGCVIIAPGDPIKIGVLQALSGEVAPLGNAQVRGLELALDKRGHKILGHPIALQIEDTGCSAEGGANSVLKIIADPQTVAIFGTTCSGAAATASRAMSESGLTMISGNNSAPFLTSIDGKAAPDFYPGYFRTAANEEYAGKAAAGYVYRQLGLRKAATIHDNDIYTKGLVDSFQQAFTELGGEIVLSTAINKGDTEMTPVLDAIVKKEPQVLFFPLFQPEGNHILLQARNIPSLDQCLLISDGALIEKSFLEAVGEQGKGMCFVGPRSPVGPRVEELVAAYTEKYGEQPGVSYFLAAFDGAELLLEAIERVATKNRDGTLHLGRKSLRNWLYSESNLTGVTGKIRCDSFGDCGSAAFDVLRFDNPDLGIKGLEANAVYSWSQNK